MKKIFVIAGEASGDLHGANLIASLKKTDPDLEIHAVGGERMASQPIASFYDLACIHVLGLTDIFCSYPKLRMAFERIAHSIRTIKPDLVVLIDNPSFNLRLAERIKRSSIPLVYYVSPQVWAWGTKRIHTIKKLVKKMIVFFGFEETLYKKYGVPVTFVGHPLIDSVRSSADKNSLLREFDLDTEKLTISIMPGSRINEIKNLLPVFLGAARIIKKEICDVQFILAESITIKENLYKKFLKDFSIITIRGRSYDALQASDFALVCSGTATLEAAIMDTPMVIAYKTSLLTYMAAKLVIKTPYLGLVNLISQKEIVPECLQFKANPKYIAYKGISIIKDKKRMAEIKEGLRRVKEKLGPPGASERAAKAVLETL